VKLPEAEVQSFAVALRYMYTDCIFPLVKGKYLSFRRCHLEKMSPSYVRTLGREKVPLKSTEIQEKIDIALWLISVSS